MLIDLCKLRPGDIVFSRAPARISRIIAFATGSAYSHAMIVVYPDVWFETDGAGSGFKIIEDVKCFDTMTGGHSIISDLNYTKIEILRPKSAITPNQILGELQNHIALTYPNFIQFLPLFLPIQPFPNFAKRLVSFLSKSSENGGGYCSQMISQILRNLYGISVGGQDDHISPGMLRRRLLESACASSIDCFKYHIPETWMQSDGLDKIYRSLLKVTSKLRAYQYPHDRASFEEALASTFKELRINDEPSKFSVRPDLLRKTLTRTEFFRLHEKIWKCKYT